MSASRLLLPVAGAAAVVVAVAAVGVAVEPFSAEDKSMPAIRAVQRARNVAGTRNEFGNFHECGRNVERIYQLL